MPKKESPCRPSPQALGDGSPAGVARRRGRQTPTISVVLPYSTSKGMEAVAIYNRSGRTAQPWQELMLEDIMAQNDAGLWTHMKFGWSIPRRNGKSEVLIIRAMYAVSHASNAYKALAAFFGWQQMETSAAGVTSEIAAAVDEQNALTDATNATADAQERFLAGFDKINKLPAAEAEASGGGAISGIGTTGATPTLPSTAEVESLVTDLQALFAGLDFKPLLTSLQGLWESVEPLLGKIRVGFSWVMENILKPMGTWTIEDALPASIDVFRASLDLLNSVLDALKPHADWLWEKFIKPLADWSGEIIVTGLEDLADALGELSDWIDENPDASVKIAGVAAAVTGLFKLFTTSAVAGFIGRIAHAFGMMGFTGVLHVVMGALKTAGVLILSVLKKFLLFDVTLGTLLAGVFAWGYTITEISKNLDDIMDVWEQDGGFAGFVSGWLESVRADVEEFFKFGDFGTVWYELWSGFGETMYSVFGDLPSVLTTFWEDFGAFAYDYEQAVKDGWAMIPEVWDGIVQYFQNKWDGITEIFTEAPDWFKETFTSAFSDMKFAFSTIRSWASGRWDAITEEFADVSDWFGEQFQLAWDNLTGIFDGTKDYFKGAWDDLVQSLADGDIGGWFERQFQTAWDNITRIFGDLNGWFDGVWEDIGQGIKDRINGTIDNLNRLAGALEMLLNGLVDSLNGVLSIHIPDNVPIIGGTNFSPNLSHIDIPEIPRLATGTVIPANYGEFLAVLGDNRREAEIVSPLSTMEQAVQNALSKQGGDIHLTVNLDGKAVYRNVIKRNNESIRMTGKNPLLGKGVST